MTDCVNRPLNETLAIIPPPKPDLKSMTTALNDAMAQGMTMEEMKQVVVNQLTADGMRDVQEVPEEFADAFDD